MKKILLTICVVSFIFACKKDSNTVSANLDLTVNNIKGKYKATDATFLPINTASEINVFSNDLYKPCKKDDLLKFDSLGVFTYADSGLVCTPPDKSENYSSPYTLIAPSTLKYDNKTYTVVTLNKTQLTISRFDSGTISGIKVEGTFKIFLTKQP